MDFRGGARDPGLRSETPSALDPRVRPGVTRGLSLIEVVASTLIVGVMAVAALNSLGAATRSSNSIGNRAVALGLADELMSEILQAAYREPDGAAGMGADTGETSGPCSVFDDVDDYQGWNKSPPQYRDGTTMPDRADWRHRVRSHPALGPSDPSQTAGSDQGKADSRDDRVPRAGPCRGFRRACQYRSVAIESGRQGSRQVKVQKGDEGQRVEDDFSCSEYHP